MSIRGVGVSRGVEGEDTSSIRGVVGSIGVGGESISSIRGVVASCGVSLKCTRPDSSIGCYRATSSSYGYTIDRGIYSRHEIATRSRETHPLYIVASEYEIDIICRSEEVGTCDGTTISEDIP